MYGKVNLHKHRSILDATKQVSLGVKKYEYN